jgi:NADH-quinone oxidoreductase subunit H
MTFSQIGAFIAVFFSFALILTGYGYLYFSRKLIADFQARVGPSLCGYRGILQPFADYLKLLQKQQRLTASFSEVLWCHVYSVLLFVPMVSIPLGSGFLMVDSCASPYMFLLVAFVLSVGVALTSFESKNVLIWYNSVRLLSQTASGGFCLLFSLLSVGVLVGSMQWSEVASFQGFAPWRWICFSTPFSFLACLIFFVSGLILLASAPMNSLFFDTEGIGGLQEGIFGRQLLFFYLAQFYAFFFWSVTCVVLFFGAWRLPDLLVSFFLKSELESVVFFLEWLFLMMKTLILMACCCWLSVTLPRPRVDQIVFTAWHVCAPCACLALMGSVVWSFWCLNR